MGWMMIIWSVVSAGLIVWFVDADDGIHGSWGRDEDTDRCACCRHDHVAHEHSAPEHAGGGTDCTQCPCPGFRPSG